MKLNNCFYLYSPEEKQPLPSSTLPTLLTKGSENLIYVFIFLVKTHDTRKNGFKLPREKSRESAGADPNMALLKVPSKIGL